MQVKFKFINCYEYNFTDRETGEHRQGITCNCYDEHGVGKNKIVKVRTAKLIDKAFGEEITCNVRFNGKYVNYEVA